MITEQDLHEAIAECQGERNPNANTCIKLAAYYTILRELRPAEPEIIRSGYSGSVSETIDIGSGSEFARMVNGRSPGDVLPVMDELMETLHIINPRLYNSVLRKLEDRA